MLEFKVNEVFCGSNALWNYVVVNAPVKVLHNPPLSIGIFTPKLQGGKGENKQYSQCSK